MVLIVLIFSLSFFIVCVAVKEIPVVLETGESAQPKLTVGVVSVMPHHGWGDLVILVHEVMNWFRNVLRGGVGTGLMSDRNLPVYAINITQTKIPSELKQSVHVR